MQGTLVMLVALSGLGCHNKGCDIAYGPPTYTSCFGGGWAAMRMFIPGRRRRRAMRGCYGGGYSGCYGGYSVVLCRLLWRLLRRRLLWRLVWRLLRRRSCYGGYYGGGCYGGIVTAAASGLFSCFHKRRAACSNDCGYAYAAPACYAFGLCAGGLRIGPGDDLRPDHAPASRLRLGPVDDGPRRSSGQRHDDDDAEHDLDAVGSDDAGAADPGDPSAVTPPTSTTPPWRRPRPRRARPLRRPPRPPAT